MSKATFPHGNREVTATTTTTKEAFHDHIRTTERLHNSGCIVEYNEATGNTNWIVAGNIVGQSKGRIGQSTDYVIVDTMLKHHIAAEELHCKIATEVGEQHPAYVHHTTLSSLHCRAAGALKSASMAATDKDRATPAQPCKPHTAAFDVPTRPSSVCCPV